MCERNPKVDKFLNKAVKWKGEFQKLREIILDCPVTEEFKWGKPCYTFQKKNIILIHGFKEYCAILFFKGVLLKDDQGILVSQTENTQATRQISFTNIQDIVKIKPILVTYINEAIKVEKNGLEVDYKETEEFEPPVEFQDKLDEIPSLKEAFEALTPGRQRGYILYFSAPKQSKTRRSRIEKCMPKIFNGKGLNDR